MGVGLKLTGLENAYDLPNKFSYFITLKNNNFFHSRFRLRTPIRFKGAGSAEVARSAAVKVSSLKEKILALEGIIYLAMALGEIGEYGFFQPSQQNCYISSKHLLRVNSFL